MVDSHLIFYNRHKKCTDCALPFCLVNAFLEQSTVAAGNPSSWFYSDCLVQRSHLTCPCILFSIKRHHPQDRKGTEYTIFKASMSPNYGALVRGGGVSSLQRRLYQHPFQRLQKIFSTSRRFRIYSEECFLGLHEVSGPLHECGEAYR